MVRVMRLRARTQFVLEGIYAAAAVILSVRLLREAIPGKLVWALKQGSGDGVMDWLGARAFDRGIDPYSAGGLRWMGLPTFGHPPASVLWFLPFTGYDVFELKQVVGHLLLLMLLVHLLLLARELRAPVAIATALLAFALVCNLTWWRTELNMIQFSLPIALLYLIAWILLRRGHELTSALMIGLAMTMKPYAAVILLLFVVARRWRGVLVAVAVYLAAAAAVTVRFGAIAWRQYAALLPPIQQAWTARIENASIQGIVLRWWWPACGAAGPLLPKATLIASLLSLAIIVAITWQSRRSLSPKPDTLAVDESVDLPFALFVVASIWCNPYVWEHYDVTLLQPLGIALFAAWRLRGPRERLYRILALALLLAIALLLSIDSHGKNDPRHLWLHLYEVANWLPWPLTLATCSLLLWRQRLMPAPSTC